PKKE
ncbi:hypothetical protein EC900039_4756, partial [Escherichia coli 90.0039]